MRRLTLSVLSLAVLAACQPATTELTEEQRSAIADTARQIQLEHYAAAERLDVAAVANNFTEDGVVASNGVLMQGEAVAGYVANLYGGLQALTVTV